MTIQPPEGVMGRPEMIRAALSLMKPAGSGFNPSLTFCASALRAAALSHESALRMALEHANNIGVPEDRLKEIMRAFKRVFNTQRVYRPGQQQHSSANGLAKVIPVPTDSLH